MPIVLGIDSSTQSTKAELRDAETGRLLGQGRAPHPHTTPPKSEQDPRTWWAALREAVRALPRLRIDAVSVAAQQMGLVATDAAGLPLRPAKLWNDTESAAEARALLDARDGTFWAHTVGSVPVPSFTITKLSWLRNHEPDHFVRARHFLLPHDFLTFKLTGQFVTDRGDASSTGYYLDGYARDALALVGDPEDLLPKLPRVLAPLEAAGVVSEVAARDLDLDMEGALVACGTGDNMAAALALALCPGDVAISLGTSGTVYAVTDNPVCDPSGAVGSFADATGRYLPLACTLNGVKVIDAIARLLGVSYDAWDALVREAKPSDLVLVPYFDGERTPNLPHATGSLLGLRSDVGRTEVARAVVEGVLCGLLDAKDALHAVGIPSSGRLILTGGGARSRATREVLAGLTQSAVFVPHGEEHVALGAALQAASSLFQRSANAVAANWGLGKGDTTEPSGDSESAMRIRARFHAATRRFLSER